MTTTSFSMTRHSIASFFLIAAFAISFSSCKKDNDHPPRPSTHGSEVLDKWMTMQMRLMRNAVGIPNHGLARHFAYAGVTALEALAPGNHRYLQFRKRWNGLTGLPQPGMWKKYYDPANVNAAMATINRAMFPNASAADKTAIDSLEAALLQSFLTKEPQAVITTSSEFGKAVATAVFNWAETDGYKNANDPYTVQTGAGLWKPTAPAFAPPATPYWGHNRPIIYGSTNNTQPSAPPAYSTEPNSDFYKMVKKVFDASQVLTDDQKAMAIFWRDVPGATTPGHWVSILQQVMRAKNTTLEYAALAYALTGISINDALISCFQAKYQYALVRPITYIREVMGNTNWTSYIGTPAHPEYVSAHSSLSAAASSILQKLFGNSGSFTDRTYDYLGFAPRTFTSFKAIGEEAGLSRLYAGIHYQQSIDEGLVQGRKVADNILSSNYLPQ